MHYTRCALCPGTNACIPPSGPDDADLLFIGEAPGKDENRVAVKSPPGSPFIGKTGDEVNRHYLPLAGLRRDRTRFTNAIRCLPVSARGKLDAHRGKDLDLLASCAGAHLYPDIERGAYRLLIPMGAFACRAVFGEDFDLELKHGFPLESPWGIPAFPMYHPALGIHEPKKMLYIRTDWDRLRRYLKGTLHLPVDTHPTPDYRSVDDVQDLLLSIDPTQPLACDTESTKKREPYCFTYSQQPGTGWLVAAGRHDLLHRLNKKLAQHEAPILFHNWLYDWPVTEALGLRVPVARVVDTMARVFHLGHLPQGLKALAFRELGMVMKDFDDVVAPYSTENVLLYYRIAASYDWPKPEEELVRDEAGLWKLYKPQGMNTKFKRFFTDLGKKPDKDVFQAWENWESQHAIIEAQCGEWPGKCISHVPFNEMLHYACRDADALLRLWPVLESMRHLVRKTTQENWRAV